MASSHEHFLVVLESGNDGFVVPLPEGETRVGRSPRNELTLRDSGVSRYHAVLVREGDRVRVVDLMSRNPTRLLRADEVPADATFVEFKGHEGKAHECALGNGDALCFGSTRAIYRGPSVAAPPVVAASRTSSPIDRENSEPSRDEPTDPSRSESHARARDRRTGRTPAPRLGASSSRSTAFAFSAVIAALVVAFGLLWWVRERHAERRESLAVSEGRAAAERREAELLLRLERTLADLDAERTRLRALEATLQSAGAANGTDDAENAGLLAVQDAIRRLERERASLEADLAEVARTRESPSPGDLENLAAQRAEAQAQAQADAALEEILARRRSGERIGRTEVRAVSPRVELSERDLEALGERLKNQISGYAFLDASPEDLASDLDALRAAGGTTAARVGLDVYEHSTRLVDELDHTVAFLSRRTRELLARAGVTTGKNGEVTGSKGKDEGSYGRHGKEIEDLQRALELSAKKIEIKNAQRRRLLGMRDAVADAVADLRDAQALEFLARILERSERKVATQLVAVRALERARFREGVPGLIHSLGHPDEALQSASHRALRAISGEDLPATRRAWLDWAYGETE